MCQDKACCVGDDEADELGFDKAESSEPASGRAGRHVERLPKCRKLPTLFSTPQRPADFAASFESPIASRRRGVKLVA